MVQLCYTLVEGTAPPACRCAADRMFCDHSHRLPAASQVDELYAGEVGYFSAAIKQVADARVGDTITSRKNSALEALPGCGPVATLTCTPSSVDHAVPNIWARQQCCYRFACPTAGQCSCQTLVVHQDRSV